MRQPGFFGRTVEIDSNLQHLVQNLKDFFKLKSRKSICVIKLLEVTGLRVMSVQLALHVLSHPPRRAERAAVTCGGWPRVHTGD